MHLMRHLADQGRTIILITHATKNVMLADKVVFLARGGYLAWFGPPDEALTFFDQYRAERDRRARPMEFDEIYAVLDDPSKGKAEEWARRLPGKRLLPGLYRASPCTPSARGARPSLSQPTGPVQEARSEKTAHQTTGQPAAVRLQPEAVYNPSSRNIKILSVTGSACS